MPNLPPLQIFIQKLVKSIKIKRDLSDKALDFIHTILLRLIDELSATIEILVSSQQRKTILATDVNNSVQITLVGNLLQNAHKAGLAVIAQEESNIPTKEKHGLILPPSRLRTYLHTYLPNFRISKKSLIYLSGVLEYFLIKLLRISGQEAVHYAHKTIEKSDVVSAIRKHSEMKKSLCRLSLDT